MKWLRPRRVFPLGALVAFGLTVAQTPMVRPRVWGMPTWYANMSYLWEQMPASVTFRVLQPWVIFLLPVPPPWGAAFIAALAVGGFAACVAHLLRDQPARVIGVGVALVAFNPIVLGVLGSPFNVDTTLLALTALMYVCLADQRWIAVVVLLPVAVAVHELALVMLIPISIAAVKQRRTLYAVVAAAGAVCVYLVIRKSSFVFGVIVPDSRKLFDPHTWWNHIQFRVHLAHTLPAAIWLAFVGSAGVAWVLAPFGYRRTQPAVRDGLWCLAACVPLVALVTDWDRLLMPAVPAVIVMAAMAFAPPRTADVLAPAQDDEGKSDDPEDDEDDPEHEALVPVP